SARLHKVGWIVDHGGETALVGAAEIPIGMVFLVLGIHRWSKVVRPQPARSGLRRKPRIIEPDARETSGAGAIAADADPVLRDAGGSEHRVDLAQHVVRCHLVGAGWDLDGDAAGGFVPPRLGE